MIFLDRRSNSYLVSFLWMNPAQLLPIGYTGRGLLFSLTEIRQIGIWGDCISFKTSDAIGWVRDASTRYSTDTTSSPHSVPSNNSERQLVTYGRIIKFRRTVS